MTLNLFWEWATGLITGFATAGEWLITPVWNNLSPLAMLSFGGLVVFLGVALVLWVVSAV